jgi:hypothetical protein
LVFWLFYWLGFFFVIGPLLIHYYQVFKKNYHREFNHCLQ